MCQRGRSWVTSNTHMEGEGSDHEKPEKDELDEEAADGNLFASVEHGLRRSRHHSTTLKMKTQCQLFLRDPEDDACIKKL
ncbi:rta1 domain, partial [Moniliophthora roreri]